MSDSNLLRASPPVAVSSAALAGVTLQDWVLLATLVYTLINIALLLRDKVYRPWKESKDARD
jgi:hypothetical protein